MLLSGSQRCFILRSVLVARKLLVHRAARNVHLRELLQLSLIIQTSFRNHYRFLIQDDNVSKGDGGIEETDSESPPDSDRENQPQGDGGRYMLTEGELTDNGGVVDHGQFENSWCFEHRQVVVDVEPQSSPETSVADILHPGGPAARVVNPATAPQELPQTEIEHISSSIEEFKGT